MKKNIKYKLSFTSIIADIVVVFLTLVLTGGSLYLFFVNMNQVAERNDKKPVATVTFKYKAVQRKFLDRAIWDRPVQQSPVYNGDTIRTASDSEATLWFSDKNTVELGANTMIQVFVHNEETQVDLNSGKLAVKASDASMRLRSNNTEVQVTDGSTLMADAGTDQQQGLKLVVEKGNVEVTGTDGQAKMVEQGQALYEGKKPALFVLSPADSAKFLSQNSDGAPIFFTWNSTFAENEELVLETAYNRSFTENLESVSVTGLHELTVVKKTGNLYWRLYPKKDGISADTIAKGSVKILNAPLPKPIAPTKNEVYVYRLKNPPVRFLWEGNDYAASYKLEVASNPDFLQPIYSEYVNMTSVTLQNFGEGKWYWRITPRYLIGSPVDAISSKSYSFEISKKGQLEAPQLLYPVNFTDTSNNKAVTFSWKNNSEASSYILRVANNTNMNQPVIEKTLKTNYFTLDQAAQILKNGTWYWTVIAIDSEGAKSAPANPMVMTTMDTQVVFKTVFPPNNYILADSLCYDTRFVWKTNLEFTQRFQVSKTEDFKTLTVDTVTNNANMQGITLPQGQWYWRVRVDNGAFNMVTPAKSIFITPPLDKPRLINASNKVVIPPNAETVFKWEPVPNADYYNIKLCHVDRSLPPLVEKLYLSQPTLTMRLNDYSEKNYVLVIQAFAYETPMSSRRYGLSLDHEFALRHLKPVILISPKNKSFVDGLEAKLSPPSLQWSSIDTPAESLLTLSRKGSSRPILLQKNPKYRVSLPPLDAGVYTWSLEAKTNDGLDISSVESFVFEVLPIPPLAAPVITEPNNAEVFDVKFFKANRQIAFKWKTVPSATNYVLTIKDNSGKSIFSTNVEAKKIQTEYVYNFDQLNLLSRNTFYFVVKAERYIENNVLLQNGLESNISFTVDLPALPQVQPNKTGTLYGK